MPSKIFYASKFFSSSTVQHLSCTGVEKCLLHPITKVNRKVAPVQDTMAYR